MSQSLIGEPYPQREPHTPQQIYRQVITYLLGRHTNVDLTAKDIERTVNSGNKYPKPDKTIEEIVNLGLRLAEPEDTNLLVSAVDQLLQFMPQTDIDRDSICNRALQLFTPQELMILKKNAILKYIGESDRGMVSVKNQLDQEAGQVKGEFIRKVYEASLLRGLRDSWAADSGEVIKRPSFRDSLYERLPTLLPHESKYYFALMIPQEDKEYRRMTGEELADLPPFNDYLVVTDENKNVQLMRSLFFEKKYRPLLKLYLLIPITRIEEGRFQELAQVFDKSAEVKLESLQRLNFELGHHFFSVLFKAAKRGNVIIHQAHRSPGDQQRVLTEIKGTKPVERSSIGEQPTLIRKFSVSHNGDLLQISYEPAFTSRSAEHIEYNKAEQPNTVYIKQSSDRQDPLEFAVAGTNSSDLCWLNMEDKANEAFFDGNPVVNFLYGNIIFDLFNFDEKLGSIMFNRKLQETRNFLDQASRLTLPEFLQKLRTLPSYPGTEYFPGDHFEFIGQARPRQINPRDN